MILLIYKIGFWTLFAKVLQDVSFPRLITFSLLYCRELNELNPIGSEAVGWPSASHLRGFRTVSVCPKVPMPLLGSLSGVGDEWSEIEHRFGDHEAKVGGVQSLRRPSANK